MKIVLEKRKAKIDGKEFEYNAFVLPLDLGKLGVYKVTLKIESKGEKDLLAQCTEHASFELEQKFTQDGNVYVVPMIYINTTGIDLKLNQF